MQHVLMTKRKHSHRLNIQVQNQKELGGTRTVLRHMEHARKDVNLARRFLIPVRVVVLDVKTDAKKWI